MFDFGLYTQVSDSGPHSPLVSSVISLFFLPLSLPLSDVTEFLWETARYRLKYCLKVQINPKWPIVTTLATSFLEFMWYCKNSKNWDTLNYYRDCPTNGIVGFYSAILRSKDADRITNKVDPDQTAP